MNMYDDYIIDTGLFFIYLEEKVWNCKYNNFNIFELLKLCVSIEII